LKREATKSVIAVIDHFECAATWLAEDDLTARLGVSRTRDVRRRYLEPLEEAGVVECSHTSEGRLWRLAEGWEAAVEAMFERDEVIERDAYGGKTADERQKQGHAAARAGYRNRQQNRPDESPSERAMSTYREAWQTRRATSGEVRKLERVPEPLPMRDLYGLIDKVVITNAGRGRLWQAFSDRVGVVLDDAPGVVTFMHPVDVKGAA